MIALLLPHLAHGNKCFSPSFHFPASICYTATCWKEFNNPLDSGHLEDHADEAKEMIDLADSMRQHCYSSTRINPP
jgi:hypothetical protein